MRGRACATADTGCERAGRARAAVRTQVEQRAVGAVGDQSHRSFVERRRHRWTQLHELRHGQAPPNQGECLLEEKIRKEYEATTDVEISQRRRRAMLTLEPARQKQSSTEEQHHHHNSTVLLNL